MSHLSADKPKLTARIRRIAGQVAAIERSIDGDAECATILQQVAAAKGALNGLLEELIVDHLEHHVVAADLSESQRRQGADDLIALVRRYQK